LKIETRPKRVKEKQEGWKGESKGEKLRNEKKNADIWRKKDREWLNERWGGGEK
jgi:hypothetical protein